ncbi:MAG: glycerol-3-phosphate 1-O-acyltransferase PlsY [Lachnospiraceae bacterium]|nr:glycerol-3-phosphate 1-O-acyltransferase PlsY [Lachnospiraceae bacterium]MBP5254862.1 glycerol-3-phosphate 1-O-acyltransferase PlsY [Lachnospiraceae bacterium]
MIRLLLLAIGYLFGLFQTGYIVSRVTGVNLREKGSGNTGATNALRVMGFKNALIVFLGDALKAFIPCFAVRMIFREDPYCLVYLAWTALGVMLGNDYPFYLKFKGGKGVSVAAGWVLAWSWAVWLPAISLFFVIALTTGLVSLSSIIANLVVVVLAGVYLFVKYSPEWLTPPNIEFWIMTAVLAGLVIFRHKDNIVRLLNGTENRFRGIGKKKDA